MGSGLERPGDQGVRAAELQRSLFTIRPGGSGFRDLESRELRVKGQASIV